MCGVGAEIVARFSDSDAAWNSLDAPVRRLSGLDVAMPYSSVLERLVLPDQRRIIGGVLGLLNLKD